MEYEIKPKSKLSPGISEMWEFRELFYFFTWRDVKVKYKQAVLGIAWALLQPLLMTAVFTFLLTPYAGAASLSIPYPVFALSGFVLWGIFGNGLGNAANSMVNNANIIKKIYFPRLIIPVSGILVSIVDFLFALPLLVVVALVYGVSFSWSALLFFPLAVVLAFIATVGPGTLLGAMNVKYRDIRYVIPFMTQFLLFVTPVIYPIEISSGPLIRKILQFNPMAGPLELFRGIFSGYVINWETVLLSLTTSLVLLVAGIFYFRKTESFFADLA